MFHEQKCKENHQSMMLKVLFINQRYFCAL